MARIFLSKADVTGVEEQYVLDAMRSGWIAPLGPHVDAFEAEVAQRVGVRGALALSSGTAALHLALLALGAGPGTVVVLPSLTFAASANAIAYTGASPVFVDSQASDGNVDPELLIDAIDTLQREGTTVAAVMTVDLLGRCADYEVIVRALSDRNVPLLEDAAEAFGASYADKPAGSFGAAAVLSFNGNKIMTTSGGGMLLSDDLRLLERCRYLSTQARQPVAHYEHIEVGYNYRLSNILAALGRAQLTRLDSMISRRREIRLMYSYGLAEIQGIRVLGPTDTRNDEADNCWLTSIVLDRVVFTTTAGALIKALDAEDVEARHLWKPLHLQAAFDDARMFINGTSEHLFDSGVTLPSGSILTDSDVDRTLDTLHSVLGTA
jgi:dTDP-4-amino-4,6-dideoxygalactose transaminase